MSFKPSCDPTHRLVHGGYEGDQQQRRRDQPHVVLRLLNEDWQISRSSATGTARTVILPHFVLVGRPIRLHIPFLLVCELRHSSREAVFPLAQV